MVPAIINGIIYMCFLATKDGKPVLLKKEIGRTFWAPSKQKLLTWPEKKEQNVQK